MAKKKLSEENDKATIEKWFNQADKVDSVEELAKFVKHLITGYQHDYGTICHAITAAGIAAMRCVDKSPQGGITGFQAGCIFWGFVKRWRVFDDGPKKMVCYSNMLYPQYVDKFEKLIDAGTWKYLQAEAKKHLANVNGASGAVIEHWKSIAAGTVPFGYQVIEED